MLIEVNKNDYETITKNNICEYHKKHPEDVSYAGCCCTSSYTLKRKTIAQQTLCGYGCEQPSPKRLNR